MGGVDASGPVVLGPPGAQGGLVERSEPVARLRRALDAVSSGDGSLVVVEGPPGIGKTGLLGVGRDHAEAIGLRVLDARCRDLERDFTHGVVRQLLERAVHGAAAPERERLAAGPAAHVVETILGDRPTQGLPAPGDGDFAAMHGLYWLVANLAAEGPLALVVDDAHWADGASLRFVSYLANRLAGLPVAVVVAARSGGSGPGAELLAELCAGATACLRLDVLSPDGTAEVVRREGGDSAAFASACHDATGGNPFLLHELLSALAADGVAPDDAAAGSVRRLGPQSVSRAVFVRLAHLPAGAASFARAVAVLGDHVRLRDAAALAGLDPDAALALSDALAVAGILAAELPLRFIHPVILESVLAELPPGERAAMHARAAALLRARGASADEVAAHLSAVDATGEAWAVDVLREAARAAKDRGAPDVAGRHLRRALAEEQAPDRRGLILAELGEAGWLASDDPVEVIGHLREAAALTVDPEVRAEATILLARAIFSTGDAPAAADALLAALDEPDGLAPQGTVCVEAELGAVALLNHTLMPDAFRRLLALSEEVGADSDELLLLANFAVLASMTEDAEETAAMARRALGSGRLLTQVGSGAIAWLQSVWVLVHCDRLEEARAACEAGLADARERGSAFGFVASCGLAATAAYRAGDLRECEAHARAGLELGEPPVFLRPALHASLALALVERGELEDAERSLEAGLVGPHLPPLAQMNIGFYARGLLRAAQGRDAEALVDLEEFGARQAGCGVRNGAVGWRVPAARACLALGEPERAQALVDEQEAAARRWDTAGSIGVALHGRALTAEGDERIELLQEAHEALEHGGVSDLDRARVLLDLGLAQRRAGLRSAAQRQLSAAVALARRCGATAVATRAHEELAVAGARPRRLQFSGAESLTASERRVALMAADGMTNAQIAQALFVTAKTVENHLGRVYIKLAINARGRLAEALADVEPAVLSAG